MRRLPTAVDALRIWVQDRLNAELTEPRWFGRAIGVSCLLLALCGLSVYVIDPYHRYHKHPIISPVYKDDYRMIPNLLDTMEYDSLVAGSSMCLDFSLADVRNLLKWKNPIKITALGCRPATFKRFTDKAFKNQKIRQVLSVIDISVFAKEPGSHYIPLEPFLYSRSLLHECAYLFNGDIVFGANAAVIQAHLENDPLLNPDLMFCNDDGSGRVKSGKERVWKVLRSQRRSETGWIGEMRQHGLAELERRMMGSFEECYLALIRAHPETEFIFFYAPYSYLYWGFVQQEDMLAFLLDTKARMAALLLAQPNVSVYDFQAEADIVTDLSYYRDISHYSSAINHLIVERIAAGRNRCGPDTVAENAKKIRAIAQQAVNDLRDLN